MFKRINERTYEYRARNGTMIICRANYTFLEFVNHHDYEQVREPFIRCGITTSNKSIDEQIIDINKFYKSIGIRRFCGGVWPTLQNIEDVHRVVTELNKRSDIINIIDL